MFGIYVALRPTLTYKITPYQIKPCQIKPYQITAYNSP